MRILVLDNYDSFTYNLVHIIRELGYGKALDVYRNDKISLEAVDVYDKILLSPGPGIPSEAGIMLDLIRKYGSSKSIFGVCLGHQGIAEVYGSNLYNLKEVLHGIVRKTRVLDHTGLFASLAKEFNVCRYHSWAVDPNHVGKDIHITAVDEEGEIMGIRHINYDVSGVQFHPESIVTENGVKMVENWLKN